mmetsp:Transcript_6714/g.18967  ORF Transcript_6714/g.18967 Transcript_6714/m.18967 type:complete len:208 (+) Transcript_6714:1910-2533(+)
MPRVAVHVPQHPGGKHLELVGLGHPLPDPGPELSLPVIDPADCSEGKQVFVGDVHIQQLRAECLDHSIHLIRLRADHQVEEVVRNVQARPTADGVASLPEETGGLVRGPREHQPPFSGQEQQAVHQVEDGRTGLVDGEHHGHVLPAEVRKEVHHDGRVCAVQPCRGLVQEHEPRRVQKLNADADTPFLSPGNPSPQCVPDEGVRHLA